MTLKKFFSPNVIIILLTLVGAFLHFFNLNWGTPWYFHPDERNIATAVSQLHFSDQMNPHFFAYGSLPIYMIFFTGLLAHFFSHLQLAAFTSDIRFEEAIIISRAYSALFATALIPILFIIGKRLKNTQTGLLAAAFATLSVGLTQFAHFGTFELWLTFFSVCFLWTNLNLLNRGKIADLIATAVILGILISVKVSSLVLLPLPLFVFLLREKDRISKHLKARKRLFQLGTVFFQFILLCLVSVMVYFATNPFVLMDQTDFTASMTYESGVGLGTLPVFYTGGFYDTVPFIYQFLHVYPFLLNPLVTLLFIICFVSLLIKTFQTKNSSFIILYSLFSILFISQAILFVKWTRYMIPTLPFIYLILALALMELANSKLFKQNVISKIFLTITILTCTIFSFAYLKTAFINPDTRLAALQFAKENISQNATILSEPYDLGMFPMQTVLPRINTFNFYDLATISIDATEENLRQQIANADYIIVPSQRILQPRILNAERFPQGHTYYENLFHGKLGFQKIYETPCDIFCKITYLGDPIYWWEQTVNVFDRPPVFIFKK